MSAPPGSESQSALNPAYLSQLRHDLRTPINHVIGYSEMLLEDPDELPEGDFAPFLQNILRGGKQLLTLVNQLLDPARTELGHIDLGAVRGALRTPLNNVIGYSELLLEDATSIDSRGLAKDLERIATAGKHLLDLADGMATVDRTDETVGSPFAGDGTDHMAPFPRDTVLVQAVTPIAIQSLGPARLLVVDDNDLNRDMLIRRLERLGCTVEGAEHGQRALDMVAAAQYDLMLLDVMMPGIDGYEVLSRLKGDSRLREIPVVMLSALDNIESVVRCIEMGAEDYLPKPFDPTILRARVGASLEKKRLRDAEVEYLQQVARVTSAAADVEADRFDSGALAEVATRNDALGNLARVFQRMAKEVVLREQRLKEQVQQLKIEIDQTKKARQVAEITESDFFQGLRARAADMRARQADS